MRLAGLILSFLLLLTPSALAKRKLPETIVLSPKVLYQSKQRVIRRDRAVMPAYRKLLREADIALDAPIESVTYKEKSGPSGDKHDYWSLSPDWWPDSESHNGLPYARREGKINPDAASDMFDRSRMARMAQNAITLALAWYLTDNEIYATKATALIRAWFCDPATRALPNMQYAQSRPGVENGHHTGILETRDLIQVVDAARILEPSQAWTSSMSRKVEKWFAEYLDWLMKSELGRQEAALENSHGTWFDAQVAVYAAFTGDHLMARSVAGTIERRRIVRQILPDGTMPREQAQPRPRNAIFFNLEAFFVLCCVGDHYSFDLWDWQDPVGPGIRPALNAIAPFINPEKAWALGADGRFNPYDYVPLFRRAALVYKEPRYLEFLDALPAKKLAQDRSTLFY